jgi:hypothetical protein
VAVQFHELKLSPCLALPPFRRCAVMMVTMLTEGKEKNTFIPMHTPKTTLAGYMTNEIKVQCVEGA